MEDFISECFVLLEVEERQRKTLESRVRHIISQSEVSDPSQIYRMITEELEKQNSSYRERFFTHLDAKPYADG